MSAVSAESSHAPAGVASSAGQPNGGPASGGTDFGPNEWLVDELYQRYQKDPASVDRAWWSFFADYRPPTESPDNGSQAAPPAAASPSAGQPTAAAQATATKATQAPPAQQPAAPAADAGVETRLRGAAARTAVNMEASLSVPTANFILFSGTRASGADRGGNDPAHACCLLCTRM